MEIIANLEQAQPHCQRGVALGFFDGVHRGHQDLVRTLAYHCQIKGLIPTVFTFPRHPSETIDPEGRFVGYLSNLEQRATLLADQGVAEVYLQTFTAQFAAMAPLDFLDQVLRLRLNARLIVVGRDYRFGQRGHGTVTLLRRWASEHGIDVEIVPDVWLHGEKVSSSRIRSLIGAGDVALAGSCLGQPYQLSGTVIRGKGLGRRFDFPTANIVVAEDLVLPAYGVYATRTRVNGRTYESITNVGIRPTVQDQQAVPNLETYLYDTHLDLYDQTIRVEFLQRIRPEYRFDSLLQMVGQIRQDLEQVRDWHRNCEQGYETARINQIPVRVLRTRRFAQASLVLAFQMPLNRPDASRFTLLLRLLAASCRRYPTRAGFAAALDNLYGSSIDSEVDKHGDVLTLYLMADSLMHWTDGSSPFAATIDLLFAALLEPNLDADGLFDAVQFESERQALVMELLARENDKGKYAYDRCMELLCAGQAASLRASGDVETLTGISRQDLRIAYQTLLADVSLAVYVGGDVAADTLEQIYAYIRQIPAGRRPASPWRPGSFHVPQQTDVLETGAVEQARICLAYTGLPPWFSHQHIISTVLNSMLGGDTHSLLFEVVREQLGLAYSVYSVNLRYISSLLLVAGVAPDQVEAARAAMQGQVEALAAGEFSDELLARALTMVESALLSVADDLDNLLLHLILTAMHGRQMAVADSLSLLQAVDRQKIQQLASQLKASTCFILTAPGLPAASSEIGEVSHD